MKTSTSTVDLYRKTTSPHALMVAMCLFFATLGNFPLWREWCKLPDLSGGRWLAFAVAFAIAIAGTLVCFLAMVCWNKSTKPILMAMLILASVGAYFMHTYGIVIDTTMLTNTLQTDPKEALDLMNSRFLLWIFASAILPCIWLWRLNLQTVSFLSHIKKNALLFLGGALLTLTATLPMYADFASVMRNNVKLRYLVNPMNSVHAILNLSVQHSRGFFMGASSKNQVLVPIAQDATWAPVAFDKRGAYNKGTLNGTNDAVVKPVLLVMVVGETARSDRFGINGYAKNTTPELQKIAQRATKNTNNSTVPFFLTLQDVWSCGTNTAVSVPCMFSHLGRDRQKENPALFENLLDVLQKTNFQVLWLDNQSGCKGVCARLPEKYINTCPNGVGDGDCLDTAMLPYLLKSIENKSVKGDKGDKKIGHSKNTVIVMHQMGSHGPAYTKRSALDRKFFLPECKSNTFSDCTTTEINNVYDNSIVETDHFLASTIGVLQQEMVQKSFATAMIYVSDHGESLGEGNLYLHGLPYAIAPDVQKKVPWVSWLSVDFLQQSGLNTQCLRQPTQATVTYPLTHDHFFHSVLGLLSVQTQLHNKTLDIYGGCRNSFFTSSLASQVHQK